MPSAAFVRLRVGKGEHDGAGGPALEDDGGGGGRSAAGPTSFRSEADPLASAASYIGARPGPNGSSFQAGQAAGSAPFFVAHDGRGRRA
jgi:hypothetical protein